MWRVKESKYEKTREICLCSQSIPEPIPVLESILIPMLKLIPILEPIPESISELGPEPIPELDPESAPESGSGLESQFVSITESDSTPELELILEWESALELK